MSLSESSYQKKTEGGVTGRSRVQPLPTLALVGSHDPLRNWSPVELTKPVQPPLSKHVESWQGHEAPPASPRKAKVKIPALQNSCTFSFVPNQCFLIGRARRSRPTRLNAAETPLATMWSTGKERSPAYVVSEVEFGKACLFDDRRNFLPLGCGELIHESRSLRAVYCSIIRNKLP